jgi:hypothetical protein
MSSYLIFDELGPLKRELERILVDETDVEKSKIYG